MIIQCDHCSARFKMDDSKLANGPVKVRCAKCKEVFVVRPEGPAAESVAPPLPVAVPPPAERTEAAEFSFDTPPSSSNDLAAQAADDFSFDIESTAVSKKADSGQADSANEFDWQSGTAPESDSVAGSRFDLSSFDASLDAPNVAVDSASAAVGSTSALAEDNDFDFGEVDFSAPTAPPETSSVVAGSADTDEFAMDFGEVSFSDQTTSGGAKDTSPGAAAEENATFSDSHSSSAESATAEDFLLSFAADSPLQGSSAAIDKKAAENGNSTDFSFAGKRDSLDPENSASGLNLQDQAHDDFGASGFSEVESEEEPPPSSLTSRKKSGSLFPLVVIVGAIFLIVALVGSGVYFISGPKAFSKVGLGFLVGDKGPEEGSIALKDVTASYMVNSTAGELFVVRGEAVNNYSKPRASIQVKVNLLGPGGANLVTKSAYCGNSLSNEQLTTLPLAKIEEIMSNQFGDSLANLGLKPGATIPFVVVVSPLPKDATDYSVVVGGSTVATQ